MGIFSGLKSKDKAAFPWIELTSIEELNAAFESSTSRTVVLFKHSTRCSISSMAKARFENNWNSDIENCDLYYLDLIANRNISNEIAEITGVEHQSPQAIVLKNKQVIYEATHSSIDAKEIEELIKA